MWLVRRRSRWCRHWCVTWLRECLSMPTFIVVSGPCTLAEGGRCVGRWPGGYLPNEDCQIMVAREGQLGACPMDGTSLGMGAVKMVATTATILPCLMGPRCVITISTARLALRSIMATFSHGTRTTGDRPTRWHGQCRSAVSHRMGTGRCHRLPSPTATRRPSCFLPLKQRPPCHPHRSGRGPGASSLLFLV
jgi:hypothetical protein